jgi:CHAT domain-containing protein
MMIEKAHWIAILTFLLCTTDVYSQDWTSVYASAQKSYEANDLKNAYTQAHSALDQYLKESGALTDNYAAILRLLENICYTEGKFEEGLKHVDKELAVRQDKGNEAFATVLSQKGMFLQAMEKYAAADSALRASLSILEKFYKSSDFVLVESKAAIGVNAYLREDFSTAFSLFNETLAVPFDEISTVFLQAYFFRGILNEERGEFSRALKDFSIVEQVYEAQQFANTVEFASLLYNKGLALQGQGLFKEAEVTFAKAGNILTALNEFQGDYPSIVSARARNFYSLGEVEKAKELFTVSLANVPAAQQALFLSGKASFLAESSLLTEAITTYKAALAKLERNNKSHLRLYADIQENLAVLIDEQSHSEEALKMLEDSEKLLYQLYGGEDPSFASISIKKGNIAIRDGRFAEAAVLFKNALRLVPRPTHRDAISARAGIGLLYLNSGQIHRADSTFAQMLANYKAGKYAYDDTYPTILNNFAAVKQSRNEFLAARQLLIESATYIRKRSGALNLGYARALENLGYLDLNTGSSSLAKSEIDSSLLIYQRLQGPASLAFAQAMVNKGKYHQQAGEYSLAEPCFRKAFEIISTSKESTPEQYVQAANGMAVYYQTMGNFERAEPLFVQIKQKIENTKGKNSAEYATVLQNMATLHQLKDELAVAQPLLEEALAIDKKVYGDNHPNYIITLRNLAAVYQKTGKLENARILLELALTSTKNTFGVDHPSYASSVSNLASLYQDLGKMKEAEKAWSESVSIRKKLLGENHPDYSRSLYGLATVYFGQGKLSEAKELYKQVVGQYLRQIHENFPTLSEKEKGAFYQKIKPVFDTYQDFCIQYYSKNKGDQQVLQELYHAQLATKAILLNSSNKVRQNILSSGDTSLVNRFKNWLSVKERIVHYYSLTNEERKQAADVKILEQKANDIEKQLSTSSAIFKDEFSEREITTTDIVKLLSPGEAAIEILRVQRKFVKDSVYYVALILKNGSDIPALVTWPYGQKLENRFYRFHRNAIKYHFQDSISYRYYWEPIARAVSDSKKIFLSPDGIFNKINFNIIQDPQRKFVLDEKEIHLVSNSKEIASRTNKASLSNPIVNLYGYADFQLSMMKGAHETKSTSRLNRSFGFEGDIPLLPGTAVEVDEIDRLFKEKNFAVQSYKGESASELQIKKTPRVKVLHIATHGFFMNDVDVSESEGEGAESFFNNPLLRSGILLAGAGVSKSASLLGGEDGILTAYEAMNIDLNETELVVLSACETALGELKNGEGVYGLQRSFIVAGTSAVMMSLWQVDDVATQELMVNFYQRWLGGEDKHAAFRKAQLMIKEKYKSPYYWGAFILVGH